MDLFRLSAENVCMLNGKKSFDIPNVPPDHVLIRFNILFAYVFEAVSGAKGIMQLKIDPSKHETINTLMHETFPAIMTSRSFTSSTPSLSPTCILSSSTVSQLFSQTVSIH